MPETTAQKTASQMEIRNRLWFARFACARCRG
jgi:hypothetical protein